MIIYEWLLIPKNHNCSFCSMDSSLTKNRRMIHDRAFLLSGSNDEAEAMYLKRIQNIDAILHRLGGIEQSDGYGPYDDMDAIPTVFKEDPVYVKPPPGLTLRSARFDNNVRIIC